MIMIIMTVMIKTIINDDDNNYDNANEDNGVQTISIFQIMHFIEPLIGKKPKVLTPTHV